MNLSGTIKNNSAFFEALPLGAIIIAEFYGRDRQVKTRYVGFRTSPLGELPCRSRWWTSQGPDIFDWLVDNGYVREQEGQTRGVYQMANPGDPTGLFFKLRFG